MKKYLFNYFIKKVAEMERDMLKLESEKASILAIIFSKNSVSTSGPSGAYMRDYYSTSPLYALDLFVILCLDAEFNGEHILSYFNFEELEDNHRDKKHKHLEDKDLTDYLLNELFIPGEQREIKSLFKEITHKGNEDVDVIVSHMMRGTARSVDISKFEVSKQNEFTDMIDRAWSRLLCNPDFLHLLCPTGKYNQKANSRAQEWYREKFNFLLDCAHK